MNTLMTPKVQRLASKALHLFTALVMVLNVTTAGFLVNPQVANATVTPPTPLTNPPLGNSCGLDITLVFDGSGSIDSTEYGQMKTAFNGFVDAFIPGTPSIMSVVEFSTDSVLRQGFTGNATTLHNEINENRVQPGGQYTNWEDGLWRARQVLLNDVNQRPAKPNVVVFASDGNPNTIGINGAGTDNNAGSEANAVNAAIIRANELKTDGTRIIALGIGSDLNVANLQQISGPVVANNAGEITATSDVIKADFNTLATVLSSLADELCGGKILVQKQIDANNDGTVDVDGSVQHPSLVGWDFSVANDLKTTTDTGALEFSVVNGSYTVTETNLKPNMHLASAICKKNDQPIGTPNLQNRTVTGLTMGTDETITCTFVNAADTGSLKVTKVVDTGSAKPEQWSFSISGFGTKTPAAGTNFVIFNNLPVGNYTATENTIAGYHQVSSTCTDVAVASNQQATCTFHNTINTAKIYGYKFNDLNGNGTWDNGEPAKSGVTINLTGAAAASDVTDANGLYEFPGLIPGNYAVAEVVPQYWVITTANNVNVTLVAGQDQRVDFGNRITKCEFTIEKSGPARVDVNGNITYTITYHNEGDGICTGGGVTITDTIPQYTSYVSHSPSFGVFANGKVVWNLGDVPANGSGVLTLVVKAQDKGAAVCGEWSIDNVASFWAKDKATQVVQTGESEHVTTTVAKECRGDLRIKKFHDYNGDGVKQDNEPYLTGWDFTVSQNNQVVYSGTTGTSGDYLVFTNIPAGTYQVTETQKNGWTNTTSLTQNAVVTHNNLTTLVFGNFQLGKISGYKFEDRNSNGAWDNGEPALQNWQIKLAGPINASTLTNANGYYEFTGLTVGQYTVTETQQAGWTQVTANPAPIAVVSGTNVQNVNFGNFKNVTMKAYKYDDLNGNGTLDQGEPVIAGWNMTLNGGQQQATNASGYASWTVTSAGTYAVAEETRAGWVATNPTSVNVSVTSGMDTQIVKFLNFKKATVTVTKKFDADANLQTTGDQTVKSNWTVQLWKNGVQVGTDQLTDMNGQYTWTDLTPGTYTVKEIVPAGYLNLGDAEYTFNAISGFQHAYTFYNFKLGKISGYKFEDMNANGTWDQGEPALEGWKIMLSNGYFLYTNSQGYYQFTGLEAGNYSLSEEMQTGWVQMAAPSDVVVTSGTNSTDNNFGNTELATITATKLIDADGDLESDEDQTAKAGWTVQLWKNGLQFGDDQTTDVNGQYVWTNLMPGTYTVKEVLDTNEFTALTDTEFDVQITSGDDKTVTFVNFENIDVTVCKFVDLNGNGDLDGDSLYTAGWDMFLNQTEATTDDKGCYTYTNLGPGSYDVSEASREGWMQTYPESGDYEFDAVSGQNVRYDFGNFELGKISGYKFEDINRNGEWDENEGGLSGWTINLWDDADGQPDEIIDSTVTDENGYYQFSNLKSGAYYLSETLTDGWVQTYPVAPGIHGPIVVTSGYDNNQQEEYFLFGNAEKITLNVDKTTDKAVVEATETVNYRIDWSLAGNSIATNVTLVDTIPAQLNINVASISNGGVWDATARTITWNFGDQQPSAAGFVTYTATIVIPIANGTQIINVARLSADNSDPLFDEDNAVVTVTSAPKLTIDKSVNVTTFVNPNTVVTYTVVIDNVGTDTALSTMLADALPAGFTFVDGGLATKTWNLGNVAPADAPITITYQVKIGAGVAKGFYDNLAVTWASNHPSISDKATVEVRVPTVLAEEADPVLIIQKSVNKEFINPGDKVTYTVKVTNIGDAQAEAVAINVRVQDVLPAGFTFEDGTLTKVFQLGDILHGQSKTITYTAVSSKSVVPGDYENVAIAWADNHGQVSDFATVEVRKPVVLGAEALPTTGGSMLVWLYGLVALTLLAFAGWVLRLTFDRNEN